MDVGTNLALPRSLPRSLPFIGDMPTPDSSQFWLSTVRSRIATQNTFSASSPDIDRLMAHTRICDNDHAMLRAMRDLRERYNDLSLSSRLPPEILARIFLECTYVTRADYPSENSKLGWISVTHVCRRWRTIALEDRALWKRVKIRLGVRWATETMKRSRTVPIVLDISGKKRRNSAMKHHDGRVSDLVATFLPSTKELELWDNHDAMTTVLLKALSTPAPLLESVIITSPMDDKNPVGTHLTRDLFGNHAPRLRHLWISDPRTFPWEAPALKNLVSLTLGSRIRKTSRIPSLSAFLDAFGAMAALETVRLKGCPWDEASIVDVSSQRVVSLPRLAAMYFTAPMADCEVFLKHTRTPTTSSLELSTNYCGIAASRALLPALVDYLCGERGAARRTLSRLKYMGALRLVSLYLCPEIDGDIEDDSWSDVERVNTVRYIPARTAVLHIHDASGVSPVLPWPVIDFVHLVREAFAPRLESIVATIYPDGAVPPERTWTDLFSAAPFVRYVHISADVLRALPLFRALGPVALNTDGIEVGGMGVRLSVLLLGLRSVGITDLRHWEHRMAGAEGDSPTTVHDLLAMRAAAGCPVEKVTVRGYDPVVAYIEALRRSARVVKWSW